MLKRIRDLLSLRPKRPRTRTEAESPSPSDESAEPVPEPRPRDSTPAPVPIHHGPRVVHHPIDASDLDPDAVRILQRLSRFDHTAYLVGGCVRDLLLGRKPKDFDIGTSATPRQVKRLFSNSRIIGRRFRLAHIFFQSGKIIEVATFRAYDVEEGDGGRPGSEDLLIREDNVFGTPEEDALRRDFTINALFYDAGAGNVLDHADGLGDLRRRLVRTIGDPEIRFREDPIRILRAIKFAARLGFEIEAETLAALKRHRQEIPKAASPRILEEINRFCRGGAACRSFELLRETGVMEVILPELTEPYESDPAAWEMARALLDAIDRRHAGNVEASTGEILSALALPLLAGRIGWRGDGTVVASKGVNLRDVVDRLLRPVALRLRVSRRDQERCRQIVQTLGRMAPSQDIRRGFKQALLHRPVFPDALWMLETVAARTDADLAEAARFWKAASEATGRVPERQPRAVGAPQEPGAEGIERGRRRRHRRRGSRSRAHPAVGAEKPASPPQPPAAARPAARREPQKAGLPSPWDDDYFFAALPTAPPLGLENGGTDRYGASDLPREESPPSSPPPEAGPRPAATVTPRKRRRRRSRRKGSPGGGARGPTGTGDSGK